MVLQTTQEHPCRGDEVSYAVFFCLSAWELVSERVGAAERNLLSVQEGCPNPWAFCEELQHQAVQVSIRVGEEAHQRRARLLGTLGTGKDHWKADLLSSANSAPSTGRQCHLCPLHCTP